MEQVLVEKLNKNVEIFLNYFNTDLKVIGYEYIDESYIVCHYIIDNQPSTHPFVKQEKYFIGYLMHNNQNTKFDNSLWITMVLKMFKVSIITYHKVQDINFLYTTLTSSEYIKFLKKNKLDFTSTFDIVFKRLKAMGDSLQIIYDKSNGFTDQLSLNESIETKFKPICSIMNDDFDSVIFEKLPIF